MGDPTDEYLLGLVDEEDEKYAYSPSLRGGNDDAGQNQVEYVEETVPNWLQFTIAVGVWLLAAFIIKTTCYRMYILREKISPQCQQNKFEQQVLEAKKDMSSSENRTSTCTSADSSQTVIYQSYDGDFYIKYDDCGKTLSGFMKIQMKNSETGCDIVGMCADADGYATITDGHVTYSGEAWWIQEVLGEDEEKRGLQVNFTWKFRLAKQYL